MNCIKMLKFTLSALLLTATAATYAQESKGEVTLKNNKTVSWSEFVNAINNPSSIQGSVSETSDVAVNLKTAQADYDAKQVDANKAAAAVTAAEDAYNNANKDLLQWQGLLSTETANYQKKSAELQDLRSQLSDLRNAPKVTASWLQTIIQNAKAFQGYYSSYIKSSGKQDGDKGSVYYRVDATGFVPIIYISFTENPGDLQDTPVTVSGLYNVMTGTYGSANDHISGVYVWLGENYTETEDHYLEVSYSGNRINVITNISDALNILANDESYKVSSNATDIAKIESEITTCSKELADIETSMNGYQAEIDKLTKSGTEDTRTGLDILKDAWKAANDDKTSADNKVTEADTALKNAQKAYDEAVAAAAAEGLASYKEVKLIADVIADVAINDFDGYIDGQSHTIAVTAPQLFTSYRGRLVNVGVNGNLAQSIAPTAISNNVVYWDNANNQGASYDSKGNETECATIGALGFAARRSFGVDFTNNKLVALTDASKVYNITVYEPKKEPVQKYVQVVDSKLTEAGKEFTIPTNMFVKSETTDLTGFDNVFFNDGTCEKVVITDRKQFYCPQTINAKEVVYDREFNEGYNAVCLPFELSSDANENIKILSTYDKETEEKFWFKKIAETVPANTPMLLVANAPFILDLQNVQLAATPADQKVGDNGNAEDGSKAWGIFKNVTREEFNGGASEAHKVYGLTAAEGKFYPAADGSHFPAFRMVIYSNEEQPAGSQKARKIAIVDEKGVEITDITTSAIDTTVASELEITTAPGEIIITSESDLGEVAVYSMDGRVAGITNVKAGIAASVEVQPGIYVVMGKKVMVK